MALKKCKECGKEISTKANACPGCGAKQGIGVFGCLGGIILFPIMLYFVFAVLGGLFGSPSRSVSAPDSAPIASTAPPVDPYAYRLLARRDISLAGRPRMAFDVRLDTYELPTGEKMRATAQKVWENEGNRINDLTVFMIFGEMTDMDDGAYGIAECTSSGVHTFKVNPVPLKMLEMRKSGALDGQPKDPQTK